MISTINTPILNSVTATRETLGTEQKQQPNQTDRIEKSSEQLPDSGEVDAVVIELNSLAQNLQRELQFSRDERSGETIIQVVDKDTDEVVREIPSKEIREVKARLQDMTGIFLNDSV